MASGNEVGANVLWLPGGLLPTGYKEAVIDRISKGKYKASLIVLTGEIDDGLAVPNKNEQKQWKAGVEGLKRGYGYRGKPVDEAMRLLMKSLTYIRI